MRNAQWNPARRIWLARGAGLAGCAGLLAMAGHATPAAAKAAKSDFMYQDHQRNGTSCGHCKFFLPNGPVTNVGSCVIVEGTISRAGWCAAFAAKPLD
jgi:High potential iron-sulfur protein